MIRIGGRVIRASLTALAAWGAIACNGLLGIEEPLQAPADAEAGSVEDTGIADVSMGDAPLEDATTADGSVDGSVDAFDAAGRDVLSESDPVDDGLSDGPSDAPDASGDALDGADPDAADGDAGRRDGSTDARTDGDAGRSDGDAGRTDAPRTDAPRADGLFPPEITLTLTIVNDQDDATWINTTDERLHYDMDSLYLEVGGDTEAGKAGLRFELPVPPGSTINSAIIELHRTIGDALADESMKVQVFDSANVPPFDDAHTHGPEGHGAGGLWPTVVGPIWVGENGKAVQTSELKTLVQHVVDRPDWASGAAIGFVFSAQVMGVRWVDFADSSLMTGAASLRLAYTPP
jgi:hypothetical protein